MRMSVTKVSFDEWGGIAAIEFNGDPISPEEVAFFRVNYRAAHDEMRQKAANKTAATEKVAATSK